MLSTSEIQAKITSEGKRQEKCLQRHKVGGRENPRVCVHVFLSPVETWIRWVNFLKLDDLLCVCVSLSLCWWFVFQSKGNGCISKCQVCLCVFCMLTTQLISAVSGFPCVSLQSTKGRLKNQECLSSPLLGLVYDAKITEWLTEHLKILQTHNSPNQSNFCFHSSHSALSARQALQLQLKLGSNLAWGLSVWSLHVLLMREWVSSTV